jgi:thiamine pyrophosphate-dependent acetolactate synthase large subunit-like protein
MAQSPVILIGGATSDLLKGKGSLQDIDQVALLKPHVKKCYHVTYVKDIVPTVEAAFALALSGTPGPVFIEVPIDVLYKESETRNWYKGATNPNSSFVNKVINWYINHHLNNIFTGIKEITFNKPIPPAIPLASSSQIKKAASYILSAKRPVLMVGSQAMLDNEHVANHDLTNAVTSMGIPTLSSGGARGFLGRHNSVQIKQKLTRREALREADVVILAGLPFDFRLDYGKSITSKATLISVNRDTHDLYNNRRPSQAVHGDPTQFLIALAKEVGSVSRQWAEWTSALHP